MRSSDAVPSIISRQTENSVSAPDVAPIMTPTVEELDWATAGTTAAAVIGARTSLHQILFSSDSFILVTMINISFTSFFWYL